MTDTGLAIDFNDSLVLGHVDPDQALESRKVRELTRELEEADQQIDALDETIQKLEQTNSNLFKGVNYFYERTIIYEIRMKLKHGDWNKRFEIKWGAPMSQLFAAYRERRNILGTTKVKFIWRGYELLRKDTARALQMEYDDLIQFEHYN